MRRIPAFLATAFLTLGVLAGCSSGSDTESADSNAETPVVDDSGDTAADEESGAGDESADSGGSLDLAEAPIPFPDGATHENFRGEGALQLFYPAEDGDAIVAFYDDWTSAQPESYLRQEPNENATSWTYVSESGEEQRFITVERNLDGGNNFGTVTFLQLLY